MKTAALILAAAAATAVAMCPNQCSGHGACTADDQCRCWNGYTGYDCAQRSCPVVEAWAVDNPENPHAYAECAGKGICNTETGTCACFDGYEGRGCERSSCPNGCSGNGKCRMLADLDSYAAGKLTDTVNPWTAYTWDEKAIMVCECDGGFMGADCSQRICPHGDDPMTVCEQGATEQVQQVSFSIKGDFATDPNVGNAFKGGLTADLSAGFVDVAPTQQMALRFKSYANEVFYTSAVSDAFGTTPATAGAALKTALEAVPNYRIRKVTSDDVTATDGATAKTADYTVTFLHEATDGTENSFGEQNLLMCPHERTVHNDVKTFGCGAAGCQPKILQPRVELYLKSAKGANGATAAAAADSDNIIAFTPESVLTCPKGETCDQDTVTKHQGGLVVYLQAFTNNQLAGTPVDIKIWAKGVGAAAATDNLQLGSGSDYDFQEAPNTGLAMTYIGRYSDFGAVGDASVTVDMSEIMADTAITLTKPTGVDALADGEFITYQSFYTTATCVGTTDITAAGNQAFNNLDVENIECSGRGECNRDTGVCGCFEGYTGLACGEQTILI